MRKSCYLLNGKIEEITSDIEQKEPQVLFFINPDETEKKLLIDQYNLDEHTLNSALDPDELSRIEYEENHTVIIFKRPKNYCAADQMLFRTSSMGFFLFKDKLIIISSEEIMWLGGKQAAKCYTLIDVLLKYIYRTISHFLEHLKVINMISEELEQKINESMENRYLINLFTLEKSLVYYLNSINSNGVVLERFRNNANKIGLTVEEIEYLEDLVIENNQCYRQADIYSNILAGLMDARVSIVSNNLNILMKTLNVITICIMVPTFVVSAFSMNVVIPFDNQSPLTFWIVVGLSFLSMGGFLYLWKAKKW